MMKPAKSSLDIGLIASDIKASLHFYQDLLGLEFVGTMPLGFGTMHRLRFGESEFKLIEPKKVPRIFGVSFGAILSQVMEKFRNISSGESPNNSFAPPLK